MSADEPKIIETVRVLSPKPGDVVVFHVRDGLNAQEFGEFSQRVAEQLGAHCPGVVFTVAQRVDDITVVRPEPPRHLVDCFDPECPGCFTKEAGRMNSNLDTCGKCGRWYPLCTCGKG